MLENPELRSDIVQALSEGQERVHRVPLVIRPFGVIAIWRERLLKVRQETNLLPCHLDEPTIVVLNAGLETVIFEAIQRTLDEFIIPHDQSNHADGGIAPGAVIVHAVEKLRTVD